MKKIIHIMSGLLFLLLISGFNLKAQDFDENPSYPLKGSWYSDHPSFRGNKTMNTDPLITQLISQVNADSIKATIQHMQDFQTRFLLLESRKSIAEWIISKFKSYGYLDVKIDSFINYLNWNGIFIDTTWQYNVVCTQTGSSAPDEVYIAGGHYDSFCSGNLYELAPGADDNATAVAATLEIARIMKKNNFQPQATIKFILFAAEELGLFGSRYDAGEAYLAGEDIRFVLNMDMISNNPDSVKAVKIYRYYGVEWAGDIAADIFDRYTNLDVFYPQNLAAGGSDSYPYWIHGFPVIYLEEMNFSPNWHQPSDTIGNCNIEYCAEITRGALAVLLDQQALPYPQGVTAKSSPQNVTISWKPTRNARVSGYNIYRSEEPGTGFTQINTTLVTDSLFPDLTTMKGKEYYYHIRLVNDSLYESPPSAEVHGARFSFTDTLLVVACQLGNKTTPDSILQFYASVLDTIPFKWHDLNQTNKLDLGTLSQHKNVLWLLNSLEYDYPDDYLGVNLVSFFENGGNMMFAGFNPSRYLAHNATYPYKFSDQYFISYYFKVDSVNRKINSFMYRAYPVADEYDTLRVDTNKSMVASLPGELYNIEVFTPTTEGKVIYRFDSHYPSNTSQGYMQGKAVGLEYMGDDFKTILLSFPLYYLDTMNARDLVKYVLKYKFTHPVSLPGPVANHNSPLILQNYPNPFKDQTTLSFTLTGRSFINLSIYNMHGSLMTTLLNQQLEKGSYTIRYSTGSLSPGIYQAVLKTPQAVTTRKMMLVK
jgi:hypothetical protein